MLSDHSVFVLNYEIIQSESNLKTTANATYSGGKKKIWSPDFLRLPTDKEIISL